MGIYVNRLNDRQHRDRYYCSHCTFERLKFRMVVDCWSCGCVQSCEHFDHRCVPENAVADSAQTLRTAIAGLNNGRAYKLISQQPGDCAMCAGSGLSGNLKEKMCPGCRGSGKCPECGGNYRKNFESLSLSERPREW